MRRTKILATLGPATADPSVIDELIASGIDAVRLNFSHGTREWHASMFASVRAASLKAGRTIAILQDLQGPKVRVGLIEGGAMEVATGSTLVITTRPLRGQNGLVSTDYNDFPRDLQVGAQVLLDEGRISLVVQAIEGVDVIASVTRGGQLTSNKGINVPGAALSAAAMTAKDADDVRFGLSLGIDFVALSFVRRGKDIEELRALIRASAGSPAIIAKIEKPQAIENLDEIIAASDGIMVARGDLGIEMPLEMLPAYQKRMIESANRAGKLVITATQMLESMIMNPFPTRAEVTDVANAVLDGTDAVMLSGETAIGKFPVETVKRMGAIAEAAEETLYPFERPVRTGNLVDREDFTETIARMAAQAAREIDPKAIVVFTKTGAMARALSDQRPRSPIVAFTTNVDTTRILALYWGVRPRLIPAMGAPEQLLAIGERRVIEEGLAQSGDTVLFLFGTDTAPGSTHAIKIARLH